MGCRAGRSLDTCSIDIKLRRVLVLNVSKLYGDDVDSHSTGAGQTRAWGPGRFRVA